LLDCGIDNFITDYSGRRDDIGKSRSACGGDFEIKALIEDIELESCNF